MEDKANHKGEIYKRIATNIGCLVDAKNEAYGDSFHECAEFLRLLFPNGVPLHQYRNMLAIVRNWDKMKRIATHQDAFGENPWQDIAGYAILMCKDNDKDPDPEWEKSCQDRGFTAPGDDDQGPLSLRKDPQ